jgi:predicted amidohydrolase
MPLLKIALLQMSAHGNDQDANLRKGDEFCRQAASQDADIALFPEMWNIGYTAYHDKVWENDYNPLEPDEEELKLRAENMTWRLCVITGRGRPGAAHTANRGLTVY